MMTAQWPYYDDYQRITEREIPVVVLETRRLESRSRGLAPRFEPRFFRFFFTHRPFFRTRPFLHLQSNPRLREASTPAGTRSSPAFLPFVAFRGQTRRAGHDIRRLDAIRESAERAPGGPRSR